MFLFSSNVYVVSASFYQTLQLWGYIHYTIAIGFIWSVCPVRARQPPLPPPALTCPPALRGAQVTPLRATSTRR